MTRINELVTKARTVFEALVEAEAESLGRGAVEKLTGQADYDVVRRALIATEKIEPAMGRQGGLSIKRTQGNRREWGASAEARARKCLEERPELAKGASSRNGAIRDLKAAYEHLSQASIADALSVSQVSVSNWLRLGNVPEKYAAPLKRLSEQLSAPSERENVRAQPPRVEDAPYAAWLREELARQEVSPVDLAQRAYVHVNTILSLLEGRTEKPQQRTRQKIEDALHAGRSSTAAERAKHVVEEQVVEEDAWYYIGLPWTKEEIDQAPEEPGVYIISDRLGRPAYIGVAHKGGIRSRLREHNKLRWTADGRVAATFSYAIAARVPRNDPAELALSLEKLLIKFMGNAILINEKDVEDLTG